MRHRRRSSASKLATAATKRAPAAAAASALPVPPDAATGTAPTAAAATGTGSTAAVATDTARTERASPARAAAEAAAAARVAPAGGTWRTRRTCRRSSAWRGLWCRTTPRTRGCPSRARASRRTTATRRARRRGGRGTRGRRGACCGRRGGHVEARRFRGTLREAAACPDPRTEFGGKPGAVATRALLLVFSAGRVFCRPHTANMLGSPSTHSAHKLQSRVSIDLTGDEAAAAPVALPSATDDEPSAACSGSPAASRRSTAG